MTNNVYELYINAGQDGNGGTGTSSPGIGGTGNENSASNVQRFKGVAKVAGAIGFAKSQFDWAMNRVYIESGNSNAQEKYNFFSGLAGQALGIGAAMAVNPAAGAAAVGLSALSWFKKMEEFNYNRQVEGIGLAQMRERAGPSLGKSR